MTTFKNISEVKAANKAAGMHFFDAGTMRFFASRVSPNSFDYITQTFITSEKRCFDDYRRVYAIRQAMPGGGIRTVAKDFASLYAARKARRELDGLCEALDEYESA